MLAAIALLPDAFVRWVLPKDALAAVAVVLASAAMARGRLPRWFTAASALAAAFAALSVLLSAAPGVQLWGRWPRYEGLVALPVYFGALWAGARLLGPHTSSKKTGTLIRATASASIALGIISLIEASGGRPFPSDLTRPGSLAGNATDQGILGALFLAVLALPALRSWGSSAAQRGGRARMLERGWVGAGVILAAASVVVSASRAGLAAAGVALCILVAFEVISRRGRAWLRSALIGASALLLLGTAALLVPFTRDRLVGASPLGVASVEGRFSFWQQALGILGTHPFGVGASGFLNANAAASSGVSTLDSPHNWLLQVALAGGLPLLIVVVGAVVLAAIFGCRTWLSLSHAPAGRTGARSSAVGDRADLLAGALAGLTGFGIALLTHFTAPATTIFAAVLAGAVLAVPPGTGLRIRLGSGAARVLLRGIRTAALAGWALWLIVVMSAEIPLASGVAAATRGEVHAAASDFTRAQSLRPWDADIAGIAAQSFAVAADRGSRVAAPLAVWWAERSRAALPDTITTERALAEGQLRSGDIAAAERTLGALAQLAPENAPIAAQHAVALMLAHDTSGAMREATRALTLDPANAVAQRVRSAAEGD